MKKSFILFFFISLFVSAQSNPQYDAGFGVNGKLLTTNAVQLSSGLDTSANLLYKSIQNIDGKLITVVGDNEVKRYSVDGTADQTFGSSGIGSTGFGSGYYIKDISNLSDGSIVILINNNSDKSYVIKLTSDGLPDSTFGNSGSVEIAVSISNVFSYLEILPNDSILVAGNLISETNIKSVGIVKMDKNGMLDSTFDSDGKLILTGGTGKSYGYVFGLETDSSNNIFLSFRHDSDLHACIAKLSTNGILASGFGTNGISYFDTNFNGYYGFVEPKIFPNGKILIGGKVWSAHRYNTNLFILNSTGLRDGNFSPNYLGNEFLRQMLIADDNTFYIVGTAGGTSIDAETARGYIKKYNSNYTIDTNFNSTGIFYSRFVANKETNFYNILLQKDRRLLITGSGQSDNTADNKGYLGMMRLNDSYLLSTGEKLKKDISLYPNPTSDFLYISTQKSLINHIYEIFDMTGRLILKNKISEKQIDVSSLKKGNYILKLDSENYKFIKK